MKVQAKFNKTSQHEIKYTNCPCKKSRLRPVICHKSISTHTRYHICWKTVSRINRRTRNLKLTGKSSERSLIPRLSLIASQRTTHRNNSAENTQQTRQESRRQMISFVFWQPHSVLPTNSLSYTRNFINDKIWYSKVEAF